MLHSAENAAVITLLIREVWTFLFLSIKNVTVCRQHTGLALSGSSNDSDVSRCSTFRSCPSQPQILKIKCSYSIVVPVSGYSDNV
jgi:hypothetical protein